MVVDREKFVVASILRETKRSLVALNTLSPPTPAALSHHQDAYEALETAILHLKSLHGHYRVRRHKKPSPQEVHSDLP